MMQQSDRQMLLSVAVIKADDDYELEPDSGTPCYFQGVFFE